MKKGELVPSQHGCLFQGVLDEAKTANSKSKEELFL